MLRISLLGHHLCTRNHFASAVILIRAASQRPVIFEVLDSVKHLVSTNCNGCFNHSIFETVAESSPSFVLRHRWRTRRFSNRSYATTNQKPAPARLSRTKKGEKEY
ncbi:hypothetical protein Hanom_Chr06g00498141 [Helianthus anomalus]